MNNFIITIGRQLGSGGRSVGHQLAEHYGISLYDKSLINLAAEQSGISKQVFSQADEKVSRSFLRSLIPGRGMTILGSNSPLSQDELFKVQSDVIQNITEKESCIILGRCADYILRNHPRLISIFLTADMDDRLKRLSESDNIPLEKALPMLEQGDKKRASYYNYYTGGAWGVASTYHLSLNTSRLGIEGTTQFLIRYIDARRTQWEEKE